MLQVSLVIEYDVINMLGFHHVNEILKQLWNSNLISHTIVKL